MLKHLYTLHKSVKNSHPTDFLDFITYSEGKMFGRSQRSGMIIEIKNETKPGIIH